jgi:hypothetical protein
MLENVSDAARSVIAATHAIKIQSPTLVKPSSLGKPLLRRIRGTS